jgi:hypothetical protein
MRIRVVVLCLERSFWLRGVLYVADDCLAAFRDFDIRLVWERSSHSAGMIAFLMLRQTTGG